MALMWSTKNILRTALRMGWILQHGKSNLQLDLCYTIYSLVVLINLRGLGDARSLFSFASCTCNFWGGSFSRYQVVNLYMYGFISKMIASRLVHCHVLHIISCQVFSCDVKLLTIWQKNCVYFDLVKVDETYTGFPSFLNKLNILSCAKKLFEMIN